jgi:cation-dependent mannose-6-phosphate receptor
MPNSEPVFRGRKLILNYTDGSPCGGPPPKKFNPRRWDDDELGKSDEEKPKDPPPERKKSTIISLLCETDPLAAKAAVSFVAASEDECTYFFEARTYAACGTVEKEAQTLSPSGVFGVMYVATLAPMFPLDIYRARCGKG